MEAVTLKLTGVLIGDEETGYTAYFIQIPNVIAEGDTQEEAKQNLMDLLSFHFENTVEEKNTHLPKHQTFEKTLAYA